MECENSRVEALAREIERYFLDHPDAADTVVGVRSWWITRQRLEESLELTQRALSLLEKRGVVTKTKRDGVGVVYFSASRVKNC